MRKVFLSLPFLLLFPALLFGSVWNSNALGQKVKEKESLDNIGWERVDEEGKTTLYYNGNVEKTKIEFPDGYEEETRDERVRVIFDEDGNISRKIITTSDKSEEYNYYYSGSLLSSYTYSLDSKIVEKCEYLRTPEGEVLALIKNENPIFYSSDSVIQMVDGTLETFLFIEEEDKNEITWNDEGGYEEIKRENGESVVYTYDGNGRLIQKKGESFITTFSFYSDGSLYLSQEENKDGKTITEYKNGKVYSISSYDSLNVLKSVRMPLSDGTFEETRYIEGVPRYVFLFDKDGERILEARGL